LWFSNQIALTISGRPEARQSPFGPPNVQLRQAVAALTEEYPGQGGKSLNWARRREEMPELRNRIRKALQHGGRRALASNQVGATGFEPRVAVYLMPYPASVDQTEARKGTG
jgi:hypothetical protein